MSLNPNAKTPKNQIVGAGPAGDLPEWGEISGAHFLFVNGTHAVTGDKMVIRVAEIHPHMVVPTGKRKGDQLYRLVLFYELKEGTRRFNRMVRNGALGASPDGRYYQTVARNSLTLQHATLLAMAHAPVTQEALDADAEDTGWGSVSNLPREQEEIRMDNEIELHRRRDFLTSLKLAKELDLRFR